MASAFADRFGSNDGPQRSQMAAPLFEASPLSTTIQVAQRWPRRRPPRFRGIVRCSPVSCGLARAGRRAGCRSSCKCVPLRPPHRMRAVAFGIKPDARHPSFDNPAILPRRQIRLCVHAARKQVIPFTESATFNPGADRLPRLIGQFELHGSAGLLLNNDRPVANPPGDRNITH